MAGLLVFIPGLAPWHGLVLPVHPDRVYGDAGLFEGAQRLADRIGLYREPGEEVRTDMKAFRLGGIAGLELVGLLAFRAAHGVAPGAAGALHHDDRGPCLLECSGGLDHPGVHVDALHNAAR